MSKIKKHIVVVGGGLSGTAAAHRLNQYGYDVTIIEKMDRLGGRIHSHLVDGAAVEMGAGFLTKNYSNLMDFLRLVGLDRQLYRQKSKTGVYVNEKLHMLTPRSLLANEPLAWDSKLHAVSLLAKTVVNWQKLDLHEFWRAAKLDEKPVSNMYRSRSGTDFTEKVLQPILNGYFYWNPEHTSEAMMYMISKTVFSHGTYRLKGGLQRIPEAAAQKSKVLLGHTVEVITKSSDGSYVVNLKDGATTKSLTADGIICATTASAVLRIFPDLTKQQRTFFEAIEYSSAALVARTYPKEQAKGDKSIAFPRKQDIELSSVTLSSEMGTGEKYYSTVKTYASGSIAKDRISLTDQDLMNRLIDDTQPVSEHLVVGSPTPVASHIQRWDQALPCFDVGHFKRLAAFHEGRVEDNDEMITFAGDYIGGPLMEGAFTSGLRAAQRLHARLRAVRVA